MAGTAIRENNVLAVQTRTGLYVIAQALKHRTLVFFNLFTEDPASFNANLEEEKVLCCVTPTKNFFEKSHIIKLKIKPKDNVARYSTQGRLAHQLLFDAGTIAVYEGTKDELSIQVWGKEFRLVNYMYETLKNLNKEKDRELIDSYQLSTMGEYGELNERLYLCYLFGKNVEPVKDALMGKKLPPEYKTYLRMQNENTGNRIEEEEWLALPIERRHYETANN